MYKEQIGEGEDYTVFKKCVGISILDFELFDDSKEFYSCFHIREDSRNTVYTDKMEFHVIEFPKLPKELKDISCYGQNSLLRNERRNLTWSQERTLISKAHTPNSR